MAGDEGPGLHRTRPMGRRDWSPGSGSVTAPPGNGRHDNAGRVRRLPMMRKMLLGIKRRAGTRPPPHQPTAIPRPGQPEGHSVMSGASRTTLAAQRPSGSVTGAPDEMCSLGFLTPFGGPSDPWAAQGAAASMSSRLPEWGSRPLGGCGGTFQQRGWGGDVWVLGVRLEPAASRAFGHSGQQPRQGCGRDHRVVGRSADSDGPLHAGRVRAGQQVRACRCT
jgi:hypothetical protein